MVKRSIMIMASPLITILGAAGGSPSSQVEGRRILPHGEIEYQYPVLVAKELPLWEPSFGPQFFFGIGVSKRF